MGPHSERRPSRALLICDSCEKRFTEEGAEVEIRTPAEIAAMIPIDMAKWANVAKAAGMRVE
jgi:tripartite-type tricarboxylate transporter receptor subunit TctC